MNSKKTETEDFGASHCSFEHSYSLDMFTGSRGDWIGGGIMTASDIVEMVNHYKPEEFWKLVNEAMELSIYDNTFIENRAEYEVKFIPRSQAS